MSSPSNSEDGSIKSVLVRLPKSTYDALRVTSANSGVSVNTLLVEMANVAYGPNSHYDAPAYRAGALAASIAHAHRYGTSWSTDNPVRSDAVAAMRQSDVILPESVRLIVETLGGEGDSDV